MKRIISAIMNLIMVGIMVNTQILQVFAVDQWKLRGIQIIDVETGN